MRGRWKNLLVRASWIMLAAVAISHCGCLLAVAGVAAGGAATYVYFDAEKDRTFPADYGDVHNATLAALHDLNMPVDGEEHKDGTQETLTVRAADGAAVTIKLTSVPSRVPGEKNVTKVSVRVALLGDRDFSYRILDQIGGHLAFAAPTPPTVVPPVAAPGVLPAGWQGSAGQVPTSESAPPPPPTPPPQTVEPPPAKT